MDDRPGNDGSRASGDGRVMLWLGIVMAAALLLVSSGSIHRVGRARFVRGLPSPS